MRPLKVVGLVVLAALGVGLLLGASAVGLFGSRTYLVLSQDPAELRAYGGYLGAYAEIALAGGRVTGLEFGDTKDLDARYEARLKRGRIAEEPEYRHVYAPVDTPDFPAVGQAIAEAYAAATGTRPDGIVVVDTAVVANLLKITGPLQVGGEAEPVTEANLLPLVLKYTQNFQAEDRKAFVFALGQALGARLRALPPTRWPAVVQALNRSADERHVQVFFGNPLLQGLARALGWDGALTPPSYDFLAVIDSNVGYNKANLVTDQRLDYRVALRSDGTASATLRIDYRNRGTRSLGFSTAAMPYLDQATYEAEVRVYAPLGSRRLPSEGGTDRTDEEVWTIFGQEISVPPEQDRSLTLSYELPGRYMAGQRLRYQLLIRKQAGTAGVPVRLSVVAPDGWMVEGGGGRDWTAETSLARDSQFSVQFQPADRPG